MRHFTVVSLICLLSAITTALHAAPLLVISTSTTNLTFAAADFAALPHVTIQATDPHEKSVHQFSGVAVSELLSRVGAPSGEKLRGPALRQIVIFRARDNYVVAFTLADFDTNYTDRVILLADQEDGKPLTDNAGPLRLIAPGDKKAARWERMVTKIEIIDPGRTP